MDNQVEQLLTDKQIPYTSKGNSCIIRCLNPEHEDSNPSMHVNKETGMCHCFACNHTTNIFEHFGIFVRKTNQYVVETLKAINKVLFDKNGIEPWEMPLPINQPYRQFSAEFLNANGAMRFASHDDNISNRIWFELRDATGILRGYVGRDYFSDNNRTKYLVKPSGFEKPWYNLSTKPLNGSIILTEGIFDALNLKLYGLTNVIALLGASPSKNSYKEYLEPLLAKGVDKVILALDGDAAGRAGNDKLKAYINKTHPAIEVVVIDFEDGEDCGALTQERFEELFSEHIKG